MERLEKFLEFIREAKTQYKTAKENEEQYNKMTQDFNHLIELGNLKYKERARLITQHQKNLQLRRVEKDQADYLSPLVDFFNDPQGQSIYNKLEQVLGKMRQKKQNHSSRVYNVKSSKESLVKQQLEKWLLKNGEKK